MILKFITSNEGKVREFRELLSRFGIEVEQARLDYPEVQAEGLDEVVEFGLKWLGKQLEPPYLIEDSGLFIDTLGGFPGVYSKFVFTTVGLDGVLRLISGQEDRDATFRSCIGLAEEAGRRYFMGECRGRIAKEMAGANGFGYDPIFIPEGSEMTFAQMETAEKNALSHRGRALQGLLEYLKV